jgi:voltage-gated potassium channel
MHSIFASKKLGFFRGNYNFLLIGLFVLFIFRPYDRSTVYLAIWKLLLTANILAVLINCKYVHKVRVVATCIAVPTVLLCWYDLMWSNEWSLVATTILSILFSFLSTVSIIYDVLVVSKVNFETLRGVICAYFLVAIGFAYLFWLLEWISPGCFFVSYNPNINLGSYSEYISEMFYFSFGTLLTIGFGDIIAVKDPAQTAVIIEGIIGQFYIAILVARLVSIYSVSAQIKNLKDHDLKNNTEKIKH